MDLPTGTVTFLFTDLEGSTELWEQDEAAARQTLVRHDQIIEKLVAAAEGMLVRPRGEGDSRFAVFQQAPAAVAAAAAIQAAFSREAWPTTGPLRVRIGLHTGTADLREGDYYGSAVNRCARVRSLAHAGQVLLSLATEQLVLDHLPEGVAVRDLGVHQLKGLSRPERVFQLVIPDLPADFPPLKAQVGPAHNLPEQLTPFVGRESEIAAVRKLLSQSGIRLVTLKGPGGIGKTRLAIEVAKHELDGHSDGARFVSLAPLDSADQIVQSFLEALVIRPASREDPKQVLLQHLRRSDVFIVADNFEHLLDGAPLVAEILQAAPRVKLLATSRERLGLRGESAFDVGGLQFHRWQTVEHALEDSAAQLFLQGARQVRPEFELREAHLPHLARICQFVDGAPLGLLLSAGWLDVLSVEEIAGEIEKSSDFLEAEHRDAPARQRSVRAVFEASWERLAEPERELFVKLSVFRGGFTREAAGEVAAAELRTLARLVDKSFVRRDPQSGRYEIHEMLRQYGEQRLAATDEASQGARRAHATYYADLLAAKEAPLATPSQAEVLDEIEADIENIRRACRYLAEIGHSQKLQQSLASLWAFHEIRVWLHAGVELFTSLEQVLSKSAAGPRRELVAMQLRAIVAFFTIILGFPKKGLTAAQHTLDWLRQNGQRSESRYSLLAVGVGNLFLQNPAATLPVALELAELGAAGGEKWWELNGIDLAGAACLAMGDLEGCQRHVEAGVPLRAATGDPWISFWAGQLRAGLAIARGDLAGARGIFQSLLDPLLSVSYLRGIQYTYNNLGSLDFRLGDFVEAELNYARSLRISHETGQIRETLANLTDLAKVWRAQAKGNEALESIAAVLHHPEIDQHALFRPASLRQEAEAVRSGLEADLDPDRYQEAWSKGSGREVDEVVIQVRRELERPTAAIAVN